MEARRELLYTREKELKAKLEELETGACSQDDEDDSQVSFTTGRLRKVVSLSLQSVSTLQY